MWSNCKRDEFQSVCPRPWSRVLILYHRTLKNKENQKKKVIFSRSKGFSLFWQNIFEERHFPIFEKINCRNFKIKDTRLFVCTFNVWSIRQLPTSCLSLCLLLFAPFFCLLCAIMQLQMLGSLRNMFFKTSIQYQSIFLYKTSIIHLLYDLVNCIPSQN